MSNEAWLYLVVAVWVAAAVYCRVQVDRLDREGKLFAPARRYTQKKRAYCRPLASKRKN